MVRQTNTELALSKPNGSLLVVLKLAVWFGLVTGLVEGIALLEFQRLDWLNWRLSWQFGVSAPIIWISAALDLLVFCVLGLCLWLAGRVVARFPVLQAAVFIFFFLTLFDWLALTGRIPFLGFFLLSLGLAVTFTRWFRKHESVALRFWGRTLSGIVALGLLAFIGIQGGRWLKEQIALARLPKAPPGVPNILVIVVDTLRADHLSGYGYPRRTSPNIDRIAGQGVLFEKAFAASSWTLPSHASLLTGRFPHEHHVDVNKARLDTRYPTIAEALQGRGYRTAAFSGNNYVFGTREGFDRGFIHFEDYFHSLTDMAVRTVIGRKFERAFLRQRVIADIPGRWRAEELTRSVLEWIERDPDKPFFAFLNYFDVHDPYLPPQPFRSRFSKKNPGGLLNTLLDRYYPKLTPEEVQSEIDAYDGAIAYVDEQIGRMLAELERRSLAEKTFVVITGDHGESFGEHGLLHHRNSLYREQTHVPLVFQYAGHLPVGMRVATPVSNVDLPATLMELAGGQQQKFPGRSLLQAYRTDSASTEWPYPLSELAQFHFEPVSRDPAYHGAMRSLVSPEWHYIWHEKFGPALYDWHKDVGELNNLASTPERERVVSEFAMRLQTLLLRPQGTRPHPPTGASRE